MPPSEPPSAGRPPPARGPQPPAGGPPPPDASGGAAFLLSGLGRIVREEIEQGLRAHGLSLRHLSALGHLSREPGLSYSELARRAGVTAQSMQATLGQLEDTGAVERVTPAGRGRTAELRLTPAGTDLLGAGRRVVAEVDATLFAGLSGQERQQLTGLLARTFALVAERRRGPART